MGQKPVVKKLTCGKKIGRKIFHGINWTHFWNYYTNTIMFNLSEGKYQSFLN